MKLQKALSSTGGKKKSGYRLNPFRSSSPVRKSGTGNRAEVTEGTESFLWELHKVTVFWGFLGGSVGKESACNVGDLGSIPGFGRSPGWRAWQLTPVFLPGESPWTQELQSMGSQAVGQDWATNHSTALYSCLENFMDRAAWQAMVHRVTKSQHDKRLSMVITVMIRPASAYQVTWVSRMPLLVQRIHPLTGSSGPHLTLPNVFLTQITPL